MFHRFQRSPLVNNSAPRSSLISSSKRSHHIFNKLSEVRKSEYGCAGVGGLCTQGLCGLPWVDSSATSVDARVRKRILPLISVVLIGTSGIVAHWQEHHYVTLKMVPYPPISSTNNFKVSMPWECYRCGFFEINCQIKCKEEMAEKKVAYQILSEPYVKQQYQ